MKGKLWLVSSFIACVCLGQATTGISVAAATTRGTAVSASDPSAIASGAVGTKQNPIILPLTQVTSSLYTLQLVAPPIGSTRAAPAAAAATLNCTLKVDPPFEYGSGPGSNIFGATELQCSALLEELDMHSCVEHAQVGSSYYVTDICDARTYFGVSYGYAEPDHYCPGNNPWDYRTWGYGVFNWNGGWYEAGPHNSTPILAYC